MERQVWKFAIDSPASAAAIVMPRGAEVLSVGVQHDVICLWALVDPNAPYEARSFRIAGTGHLILDAAETDRFLGTIQLAGGNLIFHVWELRKDEGG
ncbi:MAG: hypothetical protein U0990_09770 [Candidatus Nanopelagicales bacterium]|nr:hypothetical protein [Candidatus Nanopelagicales bacterium]